jgi:hypothetical protein
MVMSVSPLVTTISQTKSGMRSSVMPRQRIENAVASMLMAAPRVPNPATISASAQ